MSESLKQVPMDAIRVPAEKLRKPKTDTDEFEEIKKSMDLHGLNSPILLRPYISDLEFDDENNQIGGGEEVEGLYYVVEGLQRFTAAKQLNWETIDAKIASMSETDAFKRMVIGNSATVPTTKKEFAVAIAKVFTADPTMTLKEAAKEFGQSVDKIRKTLSLVKMPESVWEKIESGEMTAVNAYSLATLKDEGQIEELTDRACSEEPSQFIQTIKDQKKKNKEANQNSTEKATVEWKPRAKAQSFGWAFNEYNNYHDPDNVEDPPVLGEMLANEYDIQITPEVETVLKAVTAIYVNMNPARVQQLTDEHNAKVAAKEAEKAAKEAEKAAAKEAEEVAAV